MLPNTIIIRVPDINGSKTFLGLPLDDQGVISGADAYEFNVTDGDSYNLLEFNQLVIALTSDSGDSSLELARVTIEQLDANVEVIAYEDPYQVMVLAKEIFDRFADGTIGEEGSIGRTLQ